MFFCICILSLVYLEKIKGKLIFQSLSFLGEDIIHDESNALTTTRRTHAITIKLQKYICTTIASLTTLSLILLNLVCLQLCLELFKQTRFGLTDVQNRFKIHVQKQK
jgi:hypothetical protein